MAQNLWDRMCNEFKPIRRWGQDAVSSFSLWNTSIGFPEKDGFKMILFWTTLIVLQQVCKCYLFFSHWYINIFWIFFFHVFHQITAMCLIWIFSCKDFIGDGRTRQTCDPPVFNKTGICPTTSQVVQAESWRHFTNDNVNSLACGTNFRTRFSSLQISTSRSFQCNYSHDFWNNAWGWRTVPLCAHGLDGCYLEYNLFVNKR